MKARTDNPKQVFHHAASGSVGRVGLVLITVNTDSSVYSGIAMRPMIEGIILTKLPIVEGSTVFNVWRTPPVTPVMYFRAFNLTNEKEFLRGEQCQNEHI